MTLVRFAPEPSTTWPRCDPAGVRGGVGCVEDGGESFGDAGPDLVASLDVGYGLDSCDGALDTGNDIGSKAKLLVRVWCMCELCRPKDRFRISFCASGLIRARVLELCNVDCRLWEGSISWFIDANLTVCGNAASCDCASGCV